MKRAIQFICLILVSIMAHGQAKYVFYFIGDGMGVNQVNGTEMYLSSLNDQIGIEDLCFTQFPSSTVATTFSESNPVTDSAASGTALSTGVKTYNGAVGMTSDKGLLKSVAYQAKEAGRKVCIATSVSIDHATPACFYAHQPHRKMYYEIAKEVAPSGFDFFAGSGFLKRTTTHNGETAPDVLPLMEESGYTIARGYDEYQNKAQGASKMILMQKEGKDVNSLPYAIDRNDDDLTLTQITRAAIDFLTKGKDKGFFAMIEGGKIDWACHANDAATAFTELSDFDNAIKVAYEFYKQHPKETLIVITADHETGGITLGNAHYQTNFQALQYQRCSVDVLTAKIRKLNKIKEGNVSWEEIQDLLKQEFGFWDKLTLTWEQERSLRDMYEDLFVKDKNKMVESLYARHDMIATRAKEIMSEIAMVNWAHGSHTAGYVPVYAIGAGAKLFKGKMDNTDIPKCIAKAARY